MTEASDPAPGPGTTADTDGPGRAHRGWVWTLIVLGTVVMVLSTLNTWAERQLLQTDNWVDLSTQLLDDEEIRHEVSIRVVDALYRATEVGDAIDEQLPEQLQGLGGSLAGLLRDPLVNTVDTLLQTDAVRTIWKEANRTTHQTVVAILEDDVGPSVSTQDGKVVIDLGAIVRQVGELIGLPDGVLDAIPEDAGLVPVVESDRLEAAQTAVQLIKVLSVVLFLVVLILFAAAIYLARNWRREATRNVGVAITLGGFVVLIAVQLGTNAIVDAAETASGAAVADAVMSIGTSLLVRSAGLQITLGLLIALFASLMGPARAARSFRRVVATGFRRSPVGMWIGIAVVILALLAWAPFNRADNWLSVLLVVALLVGLVEGLRRASLADPVDDPAADGAPGNDPADDGSPADQPSEAHAAAAASADSGADDT